jgi:hypothetical protein
VKFVVISLLVLLSSPVFAGKVLLVWDANPPEENVLSYAVYEYINGGYRSLGQVKTNRTVLLDVSAGSHCYAVTALNEYFESPYSKQACLTVTAASLGGSSHPDLTAPVSSVEPLPETSEVTFPLQWWGREDQDASGVAGYDIYVSTDGGPFSRWLAATALTRTNFSGNSGHRYGFYAVAIDRAGNRGSDPDFPQAETTVGGNNSGTNTESSVSGTFSPLMLVINGYGTASPASYNGKLLEVGRTYTVTAKPGVGCLFWNWTGNIAGLPSTSERLRFVMASNAVLTANFVTNPFTAIKGSYYGLINGVGHEDSGFFSGTLGSEGAVCAKLVLGGKTSRFRGQFDLGGQLSKTMVRPGDSPLEIALQLGHDGTLSGVVSKDGWGSELEAYRAVYRASSNPCPYAGRYTLAIPGSGEANGPVGTGYGVVLVTKGGLVVMSGRLAEGTRLSRAVPVSQEGDWPLYVPLYRGKGSLMAWVKFLRPAGLTNMLASWIKPADDSSKYYPDGFRSQLVLVGSSYVYVKADRVLPLTDGVVLLSGGNLAEPITNAVLLTVANQVVDLGSNRLRMSLNVKTGSFGGTFRVPATTRANRFKGVLLQEQVLGAGYFLGTDRSGALLLNAQ